MPVNGVFDLITVRNFRHNLEIDRIQPTNALNLGVWQLREVNDGGILEEIRRKMALSDFFHIHCFLEKSVLFFLYSQI